MKHILFTVLTFISFNILAQVPQGVGYQGVATDSEGIELVNQSISIKASVLSGSANGTIEWEETHSTSTDTFGLFNLTIGQGNNTGNGLQVNFADISWGTNTHFLKIEMDATGGNDFTFMGTNQMMSVPYALYAESANINYDSISNLLSNDSTFITNVGGGTGGGGCDYSFPEGLEGDMIPWDLSNGNDYTVPAGKNLFITNIHTNDGSSFRIDGVRVLDEKWGISNTSNNDEIGMLRHPLCVKSGQVISASANSTYTETFYGVLTNAVVEPISFWFDNVGSGNESYTVPTGKKLVVTNIWMYGSSNSDLTIDGVVIAAENFNKPEAFSNKYIEIPLIVESGSIISIPNNFSSFNGYIVDEDYFSDCGGGGSSSLSNSSTSDIGILTTSDLCIEVDDVISLNIPSGQSQHVSSLTMDSMSNIFVSFSLGNNASYSTIHKYNADLNLIWSINLDGNAQMLKCNNNGLYVSGKQSYSGSYVDDFVAKIDSENGSVLWYSNIGYGNSSQGELLEVNDQYIVYVNPDFVFNGNNDHYLHIFDDSSGDYDTYSGLPNMPQRIALDNNILYIGCSYNGNSSSITFDLSQPENSYTSSNFGYNYNTNFIISNSEMFSLHYNDNSESLSIQKPFTGGDITVQNGSSQTIEFSSDGYDNIKPNNSGFSFLFNFTNHIVNFQSEVLFENYSNGYAHFLMDLDMNFNLINVKSFPMVCERFNSLRYDVSSNKHAVAVTLEDNDCSQICVNGELYSGHVLMIY